MNRRLIWIAATAAVGLLAAVPLLAQNRQGQTEAGTAGQGKQLDEHKAQEQRERDADAERAKRREAARAGRDGRDKAAPKKEEEERDPR